MSERAPEKAYLMAKGTGERLTCLFNPNKITISKSSQWKRSPSKGAKNASKPEFVGTDPRTLKLELLFEGWETGDGDVSPAVEQLFLWTCPTTESIDNNKPQPELLVLMWGRQSYFEAYLKQVEASYLLFDTQGSPIRAMVTCTFEETPMSADGQNPTSGGVPGHRSHTVVQGESLQSIAYREYRDAGRWRALAVANDIDDPFRIRPGTTLLVPPANDATLLAAVGGARDGF
jgi:nucleoid-associated protein YgaU